MPPHRQTVSPRHEPGLARRRRTAVLGLALALTAAACETTDEPAEVPPEEADEPDTALPGDTDPDPEVAPETDPDLPEGWETVLVPDEQTGPFRLGVPEPAEVWAVGHPPGAAGGGGVGYRVVGVLGAAPGGGRARDLQRARHGRHPR